MRLPSVPWHFALLSEDFSHGQDYGGVRALNPFRPA